MPAELSVIIPTFRRPLQLTEAVQSVLSQEGVSLEVIVLDDSPEHSARETIARIGDSRVTYVARAEPSGGKPALVRNEGWRMARGTFVHFLDDDDRVSPGAYPAMLGALKANPRKGLVFGRIEPFGEDAVEVAREAEFFRDGARRAAIAARTRSRRWMVANLLFYNTPLVNSACMIRRTCVDALGGYDPKLPVLEDVEFYVRAIRRFGCVFLDRVTLEYRFQGDSLMHRQTDQTHNLEAYRMMYSKYSAAYSRAELFAIKVFSRTLLRLL